MSAKSKSIRQRTPKPGSQSRREGCKLTRGYKNAVSITSAAPVLGVSVSHLSKVVRQVKGRESPELLARYRALKAEDAA